MLGSIIGDTIGSVYEWNRTKEMDFPLFGKATDFTDDSVLTVATAVAIMEDGDYGEYYKDFANRYPGRGYGGRFGQWIKSSSMEPYDSWGNGSGMRVSPVGFAFNSIEEVMAEAEKSAACTHNHPEGIKGAQATALAIYLARNQYSKEDIKDLITQKFDYNLDRTVDEIRPAYQFNESCQETVPEAIISFLDSTDYESTIRLAISLGGDSDTLACIAGGIAEAYYGEFPKEVSEKVLALLPSEFLEAITKFYAMVNTRG
jgi:ADP-ribosylglycohydrolase